jgi:hypothetical protein
MARKRPKPYIGTECTKDKHIKCLAEECECVCHISNIVRPQRVTSTY